MDDIQIIKKRMVEKGTKRAWVAIKAGISESHFSNCMAGRRTFTDKVLVKIKKALKIRY